MNNKSQGLSINVIIIVAIALIVLVVLIAIFTGRLGSFVTGIDEAQSCKSSCEAIGKATPSDAGVGDCEGNFIPGKFSGYDKGCCCT
ncbi:MAG: hypothetical protein IH934_06175 [Nanoarchaeota archaeon]|nr:hypothetical protein [Nanoarchaeota archaeon]